jgi:hypothetical protein
VLLVKLNDASMPAAADCPALGIRWEYKSMVKATEECPSWSETTFGCTFAPEELARIEVPEVVKADPGQPRPLRQPPEGRAEQVGVDRPAIASLDHEFGSLPLLPSSSDGLVDPPSRSPTSDPARPIQ